MSRAAQRFAGEVARDRVRNAWEGVRTSLWPIPVAMALLALPLRHAALEIDAGVEDGEALRSWLLHSGTGDDARNLLTALVAALITIASVMFSITMVVLSLAANQFGSRLVRTYVSDVRTQLALGAFVMTIVYCLLVLRGLQKDMPAGDVPHVAVTIGLALSLGCVLVLLLFLNLLSRSIVADAIVARVADELEQSVRRLLPGADETTPDESPDTVLPPDFLDRAGIVRAQTEGYVQAVEYSYLMALAERHDALIRLDYRAGAFMCRDGWLALVHPKQAMNADLAKGLHDAILIGPQRTPTQDIEFSIRHLVDIALRALSPGVNDPNTAMAVIDRMRGALAQLMHKRLPTATFRDEAGELRVVAEHSGFGGVFDAAFNQIRQAGSGQPAIVIHLLGAISRLAEHVRLREQSDALLRHADMIAAAGLRHAAERHDRADIEEAHAGVGRKLREAATLRSPAEAAPAGRSEACLSPANAERAVPAR